MRKLVLCLVTLSLLSLTAAALERQPNANYRARREALARKAGGIVVLFSALEPDESLYSFRQEDNFYYLSGLSEPGPALLIAPALDATENSPARPYTEILFLPPHIPVLEKFTGPKLGAENPEAPKITGFDRVQELSKLPEELVKVMGNGRHVIYADVDSAEPSPDAPETLSLLKRTTGMLYFQDVKPVLKSLRSVKDPGEVALMQKSVDASRAAHTAVMKTVKPNVTEYEIGALLQYEWGRRGCERAAYPPVVGSGHNSTILHYSENTATMKSGDVVVIDAAAECSMYAADITRTLPVTGHFTARQKEVYDIVLGAQEAAAAAFQSGKSTLGGPPENSLDTVARNYIRAHGKDLHGQPLDQYFIHGLGHYIGMDVHDVGEYNSPLVPGMMFTIEPGIYIPEEDLGVRIEDDYLVGADGRLIKLSAALPSKAEDVEKVMAGR